MVRMIRFSIGAFSLLLLMATTLKNSNGKEGRTGSPGELTCRDGCHNSFALNSGNGSITIASNMVDWQYVPGTTYQMSVTVSLSTSNKFGMGLEALSDQNVDAGTLVITDPGSTQIKLHSISGGTRRNVVHTTNGGLGSGSKTFTFNWVAPASNIGPVTFYFAGNASDNGGNMTGDRIYTGTQVATPASTLSVGELEQLAAGLEVGPNPFADRIGVSYTAPEGGAAEVLIMDLGGRTMHRSLHPATGPGRHTIAVHDLGNMPAGVYLVNVVVDGRSMAKRIVRTAF